MKNKVRAFADIPTGEIQEDILDTQAEIASLQAMKPGVEVLADKVLRLRIQSGIDQRMEFILKLKEILVTRAESTMSKQRVHGV